MKVTPKGGLKVTPSEVEVWLINPVTICYFKAVDSEKLQLETMNVESTDGLSNELLVNQIRKWSGYSSALAFISRKLELLSKYGFIAPEVTDNDNADQPAK